MEIARSGPPRVRRRLRPLVASAVGAVAVAGMGAPDARAEDPAEAPIAVAQAASAPADEPQAAEVEGDAGKAAPKPAGAPAPAGGAPRRPGIEEIVIQAGESDAVADVQAADSVTGFDSADLEALGVQTIEGLGKFTPNLEIVTSGSTTPTFFIRGVGLNDFNSNSTGAVAIYQDDVPVNSPGLQLGTIFDMEQVNVLRGPQGTGLARNASAGAIKLYSKGPSGDYGGYLRSSFGNYDYKDFEGAIEAPMGEILASRFAFRWSERDGYTENLCGDAPARADRGVRRAGVNGPTDPFDAQGRPLSICGETVNRIGTGLPPRDGKSTIPEGLPTDVNNLGNWAARGTFVFQPTLDMEWKLSAHGARRDEQSRLGVAYGTNGLLNFPPFEPQPGGSIGPEDVEGRLGAFDLGGYQKQEVTAMLRNANACMTASGTPRPECQGSLGTPGWNRNQQALLNAQLTVAEALAEDMDADVRRAAYDRVGPTQNDVWGTFLRGEIALPWGMELTSVTGYDTYDRLISIDLDFSPNILFEIFTEDQLWQATQDLRLTGEFSESLPLRWDVGGYFLRENLDVQIQNDFGDGGFGAVAARDYTQDLWSAAGYASLTYDFWTDFTLDGGFRYNWEKKQIDYELSRAGNSVVDFQEQPWSAPTGTVRLTYRFREDTHAYWKYTRGWKGGHYNATSSLFQGVTAVDPESIDAFETGIRGAWFEGRLGLDTSLFYYSYTDYQIFTISNTFGQLPEFVILNANDAEIYGAEIDLVARPWLGAFVNVRFSWLESQFLDFTQIQQVPLVENGQLVGIADVVVQNTGNRLLNSPRFKLSLTAEQTVPLGRFGSVTARYDGAWTDTTYFDATEGRGIPNSDGVEILPEYTIAQKPFWLHNLRVGYRPPRGNIEIAGWVRNLTDEVYKSFAFDASTFQNTTIYFLGEPRTYGLTFSVDF